MLSCIMYLYPVTTCSEPDEIVDFFRIFAIRSIQTESIFFCHGFQYAPAVTSRIDHRLPAHNRNGSLCDAEGLVRHDQIFIKLHFISDSVTHRTSSKRIIKGKTSWFHFVNADAAVRAGKTLAEMQFFSIYHIHGHQSIRQL